GRLRSLPRQGAGYLSLTHTDNTDRADSATDTPEHHGLSKFGEQVVAEMNRLGMLVDISHVSAETMRHVLRVARAPVIASHSSAFALADHPRNVPDDVLKLMAKNGGVVMVNFYPGFILPEAARLYEAERALRRRHPQDEDFRAALRELRRQNPLPKASVHQVVDHIEHVIQTAGIDHVGLGS